MPHSIFWVYIYRTCSSLVNLTKAVQIPEPLDSQLRRQIKLVSILGDFVVVFLL